MTKVYLLSKSKNFSLVQTFVFLLIVLLFMSASCHAQCDSVSPTAFYGTWKITRLIEVEEGEPSPEGTETSYPDILLISWGRGRLTVNYTDQFNRQGSFNPQLDNGGNDLILIYSDLKTKQPESFSIIHHIKLIGDTLHGVTFGRTRLFEWRAGKIIQEKNHKEKPNGKMNKK